MSAVPAAPTVTTMQSQSESSSPMEFSVTDLKARIQRVEHVLKEVMQAGKDYGLIPGCGDKPALLKPGAELLLSLFELVPELEIQHTDLGEGHREYTVIIRLLHGPSGRFWGKGIGLCTTMEGRYRYRRGSGNKKCPACGKEAIIKPRNKPQFWCATYEDKGGCGANFDENDSRITGQKTGKVDNDNIADTYNTVLKQAKKRSLVDAALTATAASRYFTQDMDEFEKMLDGIDIEGTDAAQKAAAAAPTPGPQQQSNGKAAPKMSRDEIRTGQLEWLARRQVSVNSIEAYFGKARAQWTDVEWVKVGLITQVMAKEKLSFDDTVAKLAANHAASQTADGLSVPDLHDNIIRSVNTAANQVEAVNVLRAHGIKSATPDDIKRVKDMDRLTRCLESLRGLEQAPVDEMPPGEELFEGGQAATTGAFSR